MNQSINQSTLNIAAATVLTTLLKDVDARLHISFKCSKAI